ncbi:MULTISPECIES: HAD hydrolase family protein [Campylobacter]|uniref:HAD hydrolase family protein n=1 Tax=Campylobacter vicugnae TaxID=1660076 RepID=UPI00254A0129|nr:HAD hydrolase family protein [Campylobacter ovis]MDL0096180.1 HAD hydrolase family protein [Campylobacter ovis]
MKNIVIDLDGTLTIDDESDYKCKPANVEIINQLKKYRAMGFKITIFTSRNMKTYSGNIGQINVKTLPTIIKWLDQHDVPYDEVVVGKPWCGNDGFYIDDRAIRPNEFANLSYNEIRDLLGISSSKEVKLGGGIINDIDYICQISSHRISNRIRKTSSSICANWQ